MGAGQSNTDRFLNANDKLDIIISCWLRECSITKSSFPDAIKHVIIDTFIYQPIFDIISKAPTQRYKKSNSQSTTQQAYDYKIKLLLVGDKNVGKTQLFKSYQDSNHVPMMFNIEPYFKTIDVDDKRVKLQIWDLNWDRLFDKTAPLRGIMGVLICYDITNKLSLYDGVKRWNQEYNERYDVKSVISKFLVGCKGDDQDNRECGMNEAMKIAKECGLDDVIETSATNNINVDKVFHDISAKIIDLRVMREEYPFYG